MDDAVAAGQGPTTALLFGRERDGLTNAELDHCSDLVWIPSHPDHPSYNLAQAVLLAGYELLVARTALDPEAPRLHPRRTKRPSASPLATGEEIDALLAHLRSASCRSTTRIRTRSNRWCARGWKSSRAHDFTVARSR